MNLDLSKPEFIAHAMQNDLQFCYGVEVYRCCSFVVDRQSITVLVLEAQNILVQQLVARTQSDMSNALNYASKMLAAPSPPQYKKDIRVDVMTAAYIYRGCFPIECRYEKGEYQFKFSYDLKEHSA